MGTRGKTPARAGTRRPAAARRIGSRGFVITLAAVAVLFVGLRLWTSDRGQAFLVSQGLTHHFAPQLATRADVALAQRFLEMGLLRGDLKTKQLTVGGQRLREYTFAAPGHLTPTQCQIAITRAARSVHGDVVRAEVRHERGEQLVLLVGFGRALTHRIVVRPALAPRVAQDAQSGPRIMLVIDDLGHNWNDTTQGFLHLPVPVTLAVLPELSKSGRVFEEAQKRDIPTLLHLPMEPEGGQDPGKHAIRTGMSADDVDEIVGKHLQRYKTFIGVNNHMGSRATTDRPTMRALMMALQKRDLVFVDSQTAPHSLGRAAGREAGVWCMANDLFLDDQAEPADVVSANLQRLAQMARKRGLAIGIAHPHPDTLRALLALLPRLQAEGFQFVTIADLRPKRVVTAETARAAGR